MRFYPNDRFLQRRDGRLIEWVRDSRGWWWPSLEDEAKFHDRDIFSKLGAGFDFMLVRGKLI